ncbi:MAG: T9SS type A sorting domain-containing protein [bacterium]
MRGSLSLARMTNDQFPMTLLDASGRKVMDLTPGDNDVRHLAPGVYFVRTALWERSPDRVLFPQFLFARKVVIQR